MSSDRVRRFWRSLFDVEVQGTVKSCKVRRAGDEVTLRLVGEDIDAEFVMPAEVAVKMADALRAMGGDRG